MTNFDFNKFKDIRPKQTRYEKQLRRIQKKHSTECIEKTIDGAVINIKKGQSKSFVIYGEPQSGKTEMMICLAAKLLDEGHKIIILLLNDNVELLDQNFQRFCRSGIDPVPRTYDQILDPSIKIGENFFIIFCKKNPSNLKNLIEKIGNKKEKVIIDDEADYATPDGNVNKKDKEATTINRYVGTLLDKNAIYIGVTATPARLDLNNTYENNHQKWIYFPPHIAYTGQDAFFPTDIKTKEFKLIHLPEENDDPKYLREAIFSFMINVSYLNTIDEGDERNFVMLVHTSGKTDVHETDYKNTMKIIESLNGQEGKIFESYLKKIWEIAEKRYPGEADNIVEYILHNKGKINTIVMNNKSKDDYKNATDPATPFTIVIGGNIISRGVTFNNLLSMFFTRDPKHKIQQDTYIQRARMFGSRGNILKYFELHIPKKLYEDWHRCFQFHRFSAEKIKIGETPFWLTDRRVSPAASASIDKSIVSIDSGEMGFELFDYSDFIKDLYLSDELTDIKKIEKLQIKFGKRVVPAFFTDFLKKFATSKTLSFLEPIEISNRDPKYIISFDNIESTGFIGGRKSPDDPVIHRVQIFWFKGNNKARVIYKQTGGNISFIKNKKND